MIIYAIRWDNGETWEDHSECVEEFAFISEEMAQAYCDEYNTTRNLDYEDEGYNRSFVEIQKIDLIAYDKFCSTCKFLEGKRWKSNKDDSLLFGNNTCLKGNQSHKEYDTCPYWTSRH